MVFLITGIVVFIWKNRSPPSELIQKAATQMQQAFLDANVPLKPIPQPPDNPQGVHYGEFYESLDQNWLEKTIETALVTMGIGLTGDALASAAAGVIPVVEAIGFIAL